VEQAIALNHRDLAAAIVFEAVVELKTNKPARRGCVPAYDFLVSDWGLYLANAGANIAPSVMRRKAKGWKRDRRRSYEYGTDTAEMAGELQDQAEQAVEEELYSEWAQSSLEQSRYKRMRKERGDG